MKRRILRMISVAFFVLAISYVHGQSFEGSITYRIDVLNPDPKIIPDSLWQKGIKQKLGEQGYLVQKYYYKQDSYISEIEAGNQKGYQAYNPKDGLLYGWQLGSDSAVTLDSKKSMDTFIGFKETTQTETILGIPCKSIVLQSATGQMTLWYNSNYFKVNAKLYEGHIYGHWEHILKKIGCLPLKMETKGMMGNIVQTITDYKQSVVNAEQFKIPKFKVVMANPIN